ncbi:SseB family protein [Candidatus Rhodobacter oscarellae]
MADGGEAAQLRFFDLLAASELFLLLSEEPQGETVSPEVFETPEGTYLLVFDREDRLASFVGRPAPYAGMTGRALAEMLAGQGIGFILNADAEETAHPVPTDVVDWLSATLADTPQETAATPQELLPPAGLPEALLTGIDAKLATAAGLARLAYLSGVRYDSGALSHMLAFIDAQPGAETALAQAVHEALTFSGLEAATLDVAFFDASDPIAARLAKVGLRFDLPEPEQIQIPGAPGMDPDKPPKL